MSNNTYFPEQVGRYHYRDLIGIGGFAAVVRCHDESLDSMVTIKVLLQNWSNNDDIRSRFLQEARLLRRVRSEYVVTVHDIGELADGRPYFVMEYADRGSLQNRLDSYSIDHFNDSHCIEQLIDALTGGLDALHQSNIVHRDIKPDNILIQSIGSNSSEASRNVTKIQSGLIEEDERILIGDLGLAKDIQNSIKNNNANATIIGGSAGYQAPEQINANGKISIATDIYAATALLWRLFSSSPPPHHSQINDALKTIDAPWREIFETGMALDPLDRHTSIKQWHEEINNALLETHEKGFAILPAGLTNSANIPCPYKGLASYQPEDANYFCGRESLVELLIKRLNRRSILVVGGPSGSGKSSLVRAGLIPAIINGVLPGSEKWRIALFTPGVDPLGELHYQLNKGDKEAAHSLEDLRVNPNLARHLGGNNSPILLCIDQFEELFTLCQNKNDQRDFIAALSAFLDPADSPAHLVIAIRADFYANCAMHPWLTKIISDNQVLVGPMARNELRQAIEKPAQHAGLSLENGLVEAILDETTDDAGSLPLIAHALVETWSRRRHNTLTIDGFRAAGGVAGAISQSADTIYDHDLNAQQQSAMRRLLLQLVTPGEGAADTRRRLTLTSLYLDEESDLMHQLVDKLTQARLLTVDENSIEVAHEALIRTWPRFRTWIDEERENLHHRQRIDRSAREWIKANRDCDLLYRGTPLTLAMEWQRTHLHTLSKSGIEFLNQSYDTEQAAIDKEKQRELRARRVRRWAISALATLAVVALLASFIALSALRTSQTNEQRAELASLESNDRFVRALAASSANLVEADPYAALILAAESNARSTSHSSEARSVLVDSRQSLSKTVLIPFGSPISVGDALSAAINPAGSIIASGTRDGNIQLWNRQTGTHINDLQKHNAGIQVMTFSPDNKLLASGDLSGQIYLWDVSKAEDEYEPKNLIKLQGEIWGISFSHDGKYVAIACEDGSARILDVKTLQQIGEPLIKITGGLNSIIYSPDDSTIVVGGGGGIIMAWNADTRETLWQGVLPSQSAVREFSFSPDGLMLSSRSDNAVELINPKNGQILKNQPYIKLGTKGLIAPRGGLITTNGKHILSGANDGKIHLWDFATQETSFVSKLGHNSGIETLAMNGNGMHLITLGQDHKLRRWHFMPDSPLTQLLGQHQKGIAAFSLHPDGTQIASAGKQGVINIWSIDGGLIRTLKQEKSSFQSIAYSANGKMLATGDKQGQVLLWKLDNEIAPIKLVGHKGPIYSVAFTPDSLLLASGGDDGDVRIWDTKQGKLQGKSLAPHPGGITRITFSPDGTELAVASMNGLVKFWNTRDQTLINEIQADDNTIWSIAYNRNGKLIATASDDEDVVVRSRHSMQILGQLSGHDSGATDAQFSPDGSTLVTSTRDGKIRLWDMTTMTQMGEPLALHKKAVWQVAWLADNQHFVSASVKGDIRRWNVLSIPLACTLAREAFDQAQISRYLGKDASIKACP